MKVDLAKELYKSWRESSRKNHKLNSTEPSREKIDDPQSINSVISELVTTRQWQQGIAEGSLFTEWVEVVGRDIGSHSTPISLVDGLLTIQASSSPVEPIYIPGRLRTASSPSRTVMALAL